MNHRFVICSKGISVSRYSVVCVVCVVCFGKCNDKSCVSPAENLRVDLRIMGEWQSVKMNRQLGSLLSPGFFWERGVKRSRRFGQIFQILRLYINIVRSNSGSGEISLGNLVTLVGDVK